MATSRGKIHDCFKDRLDELAATADRTADAIRQTKQMAWDRPGDWAGDHLDIADLTNAFDRSAIDGNYEECIASGSDPGTIGDVVSIKLQADYIAIQERAYRARHLTPIRALGMAAARRKGHGHDKGVFKGGVVQYAQDAIKAGQSS